MKQRRLRAGSLALPLTLTALATPAIAHDGHGLDGLLGHHGENLLITVFILAIGIGAIHLSRRS